MSQQDKIIAMLKQAGSKGINSYGPAREIALQLPRVMNDLKKLGYLWTTRKHKDMSVDYILISEPQKLGNLQKRVSRSIARTNIQTQGHQNPWEVPMERYQGKDGRWYWREIKEPVQEALI